VFLNWSKMVFILLLPVHVRYGLVLQSSLGRAEDGITIWYAKNSIIENVFVYDVTEEGIFVRRGENIFIVNNWVSRTGDHGIQLTDGSTGCLVRGNMVNGSGVHYGWGIAVRTEVVGQPQPERNIIIGSTVVNALSQGGIAVFWLTQFNIGQFH